MRKISINYVAMTLASCRLHVDAIDVFIAGGGAEILAGRIRKDVPHEKFSEEPLWAVVGGLSVYAEEAF
ncbi:MAG: hypothetical protein AMXMBFR76_21660 [Pseudomonadota bacterium]